MRSSVVARGRGNSRRLKVGVEIRRPTRKQDYYVGWGSERRLQAAACEAGHDDRRSVAAAAGDGNSLREPRQSSSRQQLNGGSEEAKQGRARDG